MSFVTAVVGGSRVVTPAGVLNSGWVTIDGSTIVAVGEYLPPGIERADAENLGGGWLLPGYIDLHVHGGGGYDAAASGDDMAEAVAFHRAHGTTRTLISLTTGAIDDCVEQLGWAHTLIQRGPHPLGHVIGVHLEGPFLNPLRRGAQPPEYLLLPDVRVVERLLDASRGTVKVMTLAPELPNAMVVIDRLLSHGVTVAMGHTDATYDQAQAAFDHGVRLVTHAYNAMRPPHHREPGPVLAALDAQITCEIINDGWHVHPAMVRLLAHAPVALITDAIQAAGMNDGHYTLAGQPIVVADGQARLASTGCLAGSTLTMHEAVRRAIVEVGLPVATASAMASQNPARVLGIADRCGAIATGLDADLVYLDEEFRLQRVMAQGRWVDKSESSARLSR